MPCVALAHTHVMNMKPFIDAGRLLVDAIVGVQVSQQMPISLILL